MIDLLIDGSGDLVLEGIDLQLVSGSRATAQRLTQKFRLFRGEWFLNRAAGVPWFENILGSKDPRSEIVSGILRTVILTDPGVAELTGFELGYAGLNRRLTVGMTARAVNGDPLALEVPIV